jgi:hypothetical protein
MNVLGKVVKAYTGVTASCMLAHNITEPIEALTIACFAEASKTGGIFALLVAIGVGVQQYQKINMAAQEGS